MAHLPFDPDEAVRVLRTKDKRLGVLIERVGPLRMKRHTAATTYLYLAEAILHQQITAKAAASIQARLCQVAGGGGFPVPQQVLTAGIDGLRQAGVSRPKALALLDLAEKSLGGTVPEIAAMDAMSEDDIIEQLTVVRGIGRWTAEMLLMFRLGRPDILPVDDYGVRKGFARAYRKKELPTPAQLAKYGTRWRPFRSAASWYLWRALELPE